MPNHRHEFGDEPVTNGKFITYAGVFTVLITICGALIGVAWHLTQQSQEDQDRALRSAEKDITTVREKVAALEAEMQEMQRICKRN